MVLSPPTALWVVPVADLGGVARHVLDVARVGVPGWRVVVACPEGPLADALRALGAPVLTGALGPTARTARSVRTLRRAVRTLRPAVVHSHLAHADLTAALATAGLPLRLVSTEHGIAADDLVYHGSRARATVKAAAHRARLTRFDALIAVSQATAEAMRAKWYLRRPIVVLPNGVDAPATPPARTPGLRVASIARLAPEKRLEALLDAFALLRADHPEATLTVAGTGPLLAALQAQAGALGLGDAVTFPGHVDAAALLARTDVLAQLSVWENCSYSLLDAVAAGRGVVATPVGGNPELLPARCLVDADRPADVARALAVQCLDPDARPALPGGWPTVATMTAGIARVYGGGTP